MLHGILRVENNLPVTFTALDEVGNVRLLEGSFYAFRCVHIQIQRKEPGIYQILFFAGFVKCKKNHVTVIFILLFPLYILYLDKCYTRMSVMYIFCLNHSPILFSSGLKRQVQVNFCVRHFLVDFL